MTKGDKDSAGGSGVDLKLLQNALDEIKAELEEAIKSRRFQKQRYENGQKAKEALIRSQRLIMKIHEVVKVSLSKELDRERIPHEICPPIGDTSPEVCISGFLKSKQQDVVVFTGGDKMHEEVIQVGALKGEIDPVGKNTSERSIVVGIRSQLSSVAKNFDTLMERAFAETLNLRLRLPKIVMGEVYLLPVVEYDDAKMVKNVVAWEERSVPVEKFVRIFLSMTGRGEDLEKSIYKYDQSALILVDFRLSPPKIYTSLRELKSDGHVGQPCELDFDRISPARFAKDMVTTHRIRHG